MVQIPQYTRGIVRQRDIANIYDPQAVERAVSSGQSLVKAVQIVDKFAMANEATAVNDAAIKKQKDDFDFLEQQKTQWQDKPEGFAKNIETELAKRNKIYEDSLPSERAKRAFRETASRLDLGAYEQSVRWEKTRGIEIIANRLDQSLNDLGVLGYRAGQQGEPLDNVRANLDASMVAASSVVSADKIQELRAKNEKRITMEYLRGRVESDPKSVLNDLDSKKYDSILGADGISDAYQMATKQKQQNAKLGWEAKTDAEKYQTLKQPLSIRNNNPGNIRGADGEFLKFDTPEEGARAMANDLRIKISGQSKAMEANYGKDYSPTLKNLISTWAPASENDVDAYVESVTKMTGIAANDVLKQDDIPQLMEAMTAVEGGAKAAEYFVTGSDFDDLSPSDKLSELKKLHDYRESYNVQQAITSGGLVDPSSKAQRNTLDRYYSETDAPQLLSESNANAAMNLAEFTKKYGIVPETAQSVLRGMMNSGDVEQKKFAYGTIGEIQKANPAALTTAGGFTQNEIKDAAAFNALIRSGATSKFAYDSIVQSREPISADVRQLRQKEVNEKLKSITVSSGVFDDSLMPFSSPNFADEAQRDIVQADYRRIYKEAFLQYGKDDMAKAAADAAIKSTSGITRIGGSRKVMKYPPEMYYAVDGVPPEDMAQIFDQQIKQDLSSLGYDNTASYTIHPTVNAETAVNNGRKPAYNVYVTNEKGIVDLVRGDDNMPIAFAFDQQPLLEIKKKREEDYNKRAQFRQRNIEIMQGRKPKRTLQEIVK